MICLLLQVVCNSFSDDLQDTSNDVGEGELVGLQAG